MSDGNIQRPPLGLEAYKRIVETTRQGIWTIDKAARTTFMNPRMCELLGTTLDRAIGRELFDFMDAEGRAICERNLERRKQGISEQHEFKFLRSDGRVLWASLDTNPLHGDDGRYLGALAMVTDLTEEKNAERVRAHREILHVTLNNIGDAVMTTDTSGLLVMMNPAAELLTGWTLVECKGRPLSQLVKLLDADDRRKNALPDPAEISFLETPRLRSMLAVGRTGIERLVDCRFSTIREADGVASGLVITCRDITDERERQQQLLLAQRMASIGHLAAGVAHEINNPLTCVLAGVEATLAALATPPAEWTPDQHAVLVDCMKDAEIEVGRIARVIRDLNMFAGTRTEKTESTTSIEQAIDAATNLLANQLRDVATLKTDLRAVPLAKASHCALTQVLVSLLVRSIEAIPGGRSNTHEIRISTRASGDSELLIEIHDTGAPIAPTSLPHVFDPFWIGDPSSPIVRMGLGVSYGIVTSLGGTIRISSGEGGTVVRVILPVAKPSPVAFAAAAADQPLSAAPLPPHQPVGRILVIDDEPAIRRVVCRMLSEHVVVPCSDGAAALEEIARSDEFDVILCDMSMPEMSGAEFLVELAARRPDLVDRVVFCTGGVTSEDAQACIDAGTHLVLQKPIETNRLRSVIRSRLPALQAKR